ncbi:MAG: nuclear transport factor 2 family protein [Anaerolineae bacterium]|nr:nuclear transport factor 2 family protein [Anaerolineae bacterium]
MNAEQVVRNFLSAFETGGVPAAVPYLDDPFSMVIIFPPVNGNRDAMLGQGALIKEALPDFKWGVQNVTTHGNQVTVIMKWTGTHTGTFRLSAMMPGAPDIPATGKKVTAADKFTFTVHDDKLSGVVIDSPADGGLSAMLRQLGVQIPM